MQCRSSRCSLVNNAQPALCVSIHDVAQSTWPNCQRLLNALKEVADIPVTLLVVPHYHSTQDTPVHPEFERGLEARRVLGDELALHGLRHIDDGPPPRALREYVLRRWYTAGEGEFAALSQHVARTRLEAGRNWFAQRGWPVEGFVAPAWLLSEGAWRALEKLPFSYTTTLNQFNSLPNRIALRSPSLVYSVRSAWRRRVSRLWVSGLLRSANDATLLRLSLHPCDAGYPAVVRHWQALLEHALTTRTAMTKAAFAKTLRDKFPHGASPD